MRVEISRALLGIEAGLLLLPVTLYSIFFGIVLIGVASRDNDMHYFLILAPLSLLSLLCGWVLALSFIIKGPEKLKRMSQLWFFGAAIGVIIVLIALLAILLDDSSGVTVFIFGCPALLIFLHLLLERVLRGS